jgi:ATP-dependent HslUV protease ATP-binding subunit HslU
MNNFDGLHELTPKEIVAELDRYIIAQDEAKRAVAIALRNRWRRLQVEGEMRDEITPKNILMIGPTGVGKTEISRRLAKLAKAPFIKVEASKFTEVGYVGRDVESIIRDLIEVTRKLVLDEESKKVEEKSAEIVTDQLLDLLLPKQESGTMYFEVSADSDGTGTAENITREKMKELLLAGKVEERLVEIEVQKHVHAHLEVLGPPGMMEVEGQLKDMLSTMIPKQRDKKRLKVKDARKILQQEAQESLIDHELVIEQTIKRAEQSGIVFIDEIDKICVQERAGKGPDVSREGVQRDLLPLVEGCTVSTKYGPVKTDHILFISSGAFHMSKPSDLMPEFQGRFPIRVELKSLTPEHFVRILTEPKNALIKQYKALLATEGVELEFAPDAIEEIALLTAEVNSRMENIGARRLHTLLEKLLEELSFSAEKYKGVKYLINRNVVREKLASIVKDTDLSRYIL